MKKMDTETAFFTIVQLKMLQPLVRFLL